jgi:hypothetical protein
MQIMGARFPDPDDADHALDELRSRLDIGPEDAGTQPLGTTDYDDHDDPALLAGRFRKDRIVLVEDVIARHGGAIVVAISEDRLRD